MRRLSFIFNLLSGMSVLDWASNRNIIHFSVHVLPLLLQLLCEVVDLILQSLPEVLERNYYNGDVVH